MGRPVPMSAEDGSPAFRHVLSSRISPPDGLKDRTARSPGGREPGLLRTVLLRPHAAPSKDVGRRYACSRDHDQEEDPQPEADASGRGLRRGSRGGCRGLPGWRSRAGVGTAGRAAARSRAAIVRTAVVRVMVVEVASVVLMVAVGRGVVPAVVMAVAVLVGPLAPFVFVVVVGSFVVVAAVVRVL